MNDIKVKLEDVCERGSSNLAQKDLENLTGDYPVYGAGGYIKDIDFYHQENEYIAVVKDGAGIGRTVFLPGKSSVIGTLQYLVPKDNIVPKYLYYTVTSMKLEKYYTGATIPHIYFKDYKKEILPLPNKNIQLEIVSILEKAEKIISYRKQQLEDLDNLIKSRFVELFGNPEKNTKKWEESTLSNCLNVVGGYAFKSEGFEEEGIPVLRIGNINSGAFKDTNMVFWKYDESLDRYAIYPGDLVMSLTGTVGKEDYGNVCFLGNEYEVYYLNQRNAKLELFDGLNKYYLANILRFPGVKSRLTGISRGVRQANISNKDILSLQLPIPPLNLQDQFATFVQQVDKLKFECRLKLLYSI